MKRQPSQPDGPLVRQGVATILAVGRAGLVEDRRRIPVADVALCPWAPYWTVRYSAKGPGATPAVLQCVLDGLGVVALERNTEGRQNPCDGLTLYPD